MARVVVMWVAAVVLCAGIAGAGLPAAHQLSEDELRSEMAQNRALKAYVGRNGLPDLAETRPLADRAPWDSYEVVLYYLSERAEIRFARAAILGRQDVQIVRSERPLSQEEATRLAARASRSDTVASGSATSGTAASGTAAAPQLIHARLAPDERAEAAAQRAELAASRVEAAALTAERAADRAEAVTARMEGAFQRGLLN